MIFKKYPKIFTVDGKSYRVVRNKNNKNVCIDCDLYIHCNVPSFCREFDIKNSYYNFKELKDEDRN